jgi:hypothetical protein
MRITIKISQSAAKKILSAVEKPGASIKIKGDDLLRILGKEPIQKKK